MPGIESRGSGVGLAVAGLIVAGGLTGRLGLAPGVVVEAAQPPAGRRTSSTEEAKMALPIVAMLIADKLLTPHTIVLPR